MSLYCTVYIFILFHHSLLCVYYGWYSFNFCNRSHRVNGAILLNFNKEDVQKLSWVPANTSWIVLADFLPPCNPWHWPQTLQYVIHRDHRCGDNMASDGKEAFHLLRSRVWQTAEWQWDVKRETLAEAMVVWLTGLTSKSSITAKHVVCLLELQQFPLMHSLAELDVLTLDSVDFRHMEAFSELMPLSAGPHHLSLPFNTFTNHRLRINLFHGVIKP